VSNTTQIKVKSFKPAGNLPTINSTYPGITEILFWGTFVDVHFTFGEVTRHFNIRAVTFEKTEHEKMQTGKTS
jgi:hypothetical protein